MASSRSGKSTYRSSSSSRSSGSSKSKSSSRSSGGKGKSSSSSARKQPSRRAQRRAETQYLGRSVLLAGLGVLVIALVLVRGQNFWLDMRNSLFGVFGIMTYILGPFLLYLAYLVASGYQVGVFVAKMALMGVVGSSFPVVFSKFAVHESTAWDIIKMLFNWGYTRFWSGGVLGSAGALLLTLFGRPGANIVMLLLFAMGLMVFFALTPADVVRFVSQTMQKYEDSQAARRAEATAYDTQLFGQTPEEEPLENLTGTLPRQPQPAQHPAFDVAPYLEQEEKARKGAAPAAAAAPQAAAATRPVAPQPAYRPDFDVDLGPDASTRALENAVNHDPLEKVVIGPGGTFGLDPLEQLGRKKKNAPAPAPQPEPNPEEDFELRLDTTQSLEEPEVVQTEEGELDALINRAMNTAPASYTAPAPVRQDVSSEVRLDLPAQEDSFATTLDLSQMPAPAPAPAPQPAASAIPTLGGSFDEDDDEMIDPAAAAWNAGVPVSDLLTGRAAPAPQPQTTMSAPLPANQPAPAGRLRVSTEVGNSASAPISSPAPITKSTPEALALSMVQKEHQPYCYPSLNLFNANRPEDESGAVREMKRNADILVNTLDSFGVKTKILDICRGPSVTRYELQPQAGIKVSRITSLADDIALNLATAGVRIEAPIPGKPAVGIEVPNKIRTTVNIRSVFEAQSYINMRSPLTMALGKDIAGQAQVGDLCKMPHLLIAGSTGSGKSVCVNSIIISFLFRSGPEDVKLILIDPKVVELAEYNGIPHLLMPVVTEPRKAAGALGASVAEMERRYKLFAENNVRDIKSYNKLAKQNPGMEHLPYIAIVIDELADLMMVAGKEVEDYICRIAQKARAAGIHLIVATQRPSVDVITGLIKANIPSRIAFAVSSQIDSRTILDSGGAEKLLGNGDMLFLPVGAAKPVRIQGTFVTDEEISAVLNFIKSTSSEQYDEEMIAEMERRAVAEKGGKGGDADEGDNTRDPMFEQAVECVIEAGQASTSLLQRRCKLGYARAARIMDQMEQEGVIGPYEGAKPRSVLVTMAQWQERKLSAGYDE